MPLTAGVVVAAGYACYAGAGWRMLGYLPGYASEEGLGSGSGVFLLRLGAVLGPVPSWAGPGYAVLALLGLLTLGLAVVRRPLPAGPAGRAGIVCRDALWLGTATMAALSPHYPWYLTALALPAVLPPQPGALWLMLSAPVLCLNPDHDNVAWPSLVFLPFLGMLGLDLLRTLRLSLPHAAERGL